MQQQFGQFIVLEGVEGAGKSTNLSFLKGLIESLGVTLSVTREPGGTHLAEQLRELVLNYSQETIEPMTELLLMFAARQQHLARHIIPTLQQGGWVLCDRFVDATYAYQGGGRGFDKTVIKTLEQWCVGSFMPDWVIVLDLPAEISMQRVAARGMADRFEQEHPAFFDKVRAAYLERAALSERYSVVDASQSLSGVQSDIARLFQKRYAS